MNHADQGNEGRSGGKRGEMIAVCSAKGGVGRTVLAVNLAVALTKKNIQIGLLDGNFQFGDVALAMDMHPTFTIKDAIEDIDSMDRFALANFLIHHISGVKVLAAPERPEYADLVTAAAIDRVCDLMLSHHDYLIVDTGSGLQDKSLQFIEKADQVFVISTMEMASIKNTKLMLDTLDVLGYSGKTQLIINRATMDSVIKTSDVPDILGMEAVAYMPNDVQLVAQSLNIGIPLVSNHGKSEIAKTVFKMAELLISRRDITALKPKQGSFIQQLFHKSKNMTSMF